MRDLTLSFIKRHRLEDTSLGFREGIDCFFEDLEDNLPRLTVKELSSLIKDKLKRARMNFENSLKHSKAREFHRGFIFACEFYLGI